MELLIAYLVVGAVLALQELRHGDYFWTDKEEKMDTVNILLVSWAIFLLWPIHLYIRLGE